MIMIVKTATTLLTQNKEVTWSLVEMLLPELPFHLTEQNYIRREATAVEAAQKKHFPFFSFFFLL